MPNNTYICTYSHKANTPYSVKCHLEDHNQNRIDLVQYNPTTFQSIEVQGTIKNSVQVIDNSVFWVTITDDELGTHHTALLCSSEGVDYTVIYRDTAVATFKGIPITQEVYDQTYRTPVQLSDRFTYKNMEDNSIELEVFDNIIKPKQEFKL